MSYYMAKSCRGEKIETKKKTEIISEITEI